MRVSSNLGLVLTKLIPSQLGYSCVQAGESNQTDGIARLILVKPTYRWAKPSPAI